MVRLNVAVPLTALTVVTPPRTPPAGPVLMARLIGPLKLVSGPVPEALRYCTMTVKVLPETTAPGVTMNATGFGLTDRDRKSTRLNSSHLGISYAVCCLKKKKRKGEPAPVRTIAAE